MEETRQDIDSKTGGSSAIQVVYSRKSRRLDGSNMSPVPSPAADIDNDGPVESRIMFSNTNVGNVNIGSHGFCNGCNNASFGHAANNNEPFGGRFGIFNCVSYTHIADYGLSMMPYDAGAGLDTRRAFLGPVKPENLDKIKDWINGPDDHTPRLLWLSGSEGTGKSSIAHTIAHWWINEKEGLGSCFFFDRNVKTRHQKLFSTIARDLAGLDRHFENALADIVASDLSLANTDDLTQQWRRFISEPISRLRGRLPRVVVIVIDALDESGDEATRRRILPILARDTSDLPANFRILVTSRPLPDICREFKGAKRIVLDNSPSGMIWSKEDHINDAEIQHTRMLRWYHRYVSPVLRILFFMAGLLVNVYFLVYVFGYSRTSW